MVIDYSRLPLREKLQKVTRYVRLFGISRTLEKVRAQRHMAHEGAPLSSTWHNPSARRSHPGDVAIIGCGTFAFANAAFYAAKAQPGFLRGCYDPVGGRAVSLCKRYRGGYASHDPHELVADAQVRTVFICSNHASHAEYAIEALRAGKRVHIEKPHVVTQDQLDRLAAAMEDAGPGRVFLGFNRPRSPHFRRIQEWLGSEQGPLMTNWFVAGHALPDGHWYFSENEGGRVLGNLCHWTDMTLRLVGANRAFPIRVLPGTRQSSNSDFALTFDFADGSVAAITFSAKGYTFEGVREYLNMHRGDSLVSMRDFHISTLDRGAHREVFRTRLREHGHEPNIRNSLFGQEPEDPQMIVDSARLFLAARIAAEAQHEVVLPARDWRIGGTE
jgi:predicted dehydrogenase